MQVNGILVIVQTDPVHSSTHFVSAFPTLRQEDITDSGTEKDKQREKKNAQRTLAKKSVCLNDKSALQWNTKALEKDV